MFVCKDAYKKDKLYLDNNSEIPVYIDISNNYIYIDINQLFSKLQYSYDVYGNNISIYKLSMEEFSNFLASIPQSDFEQFLKCFMEIKVQ